MITRGEIKLLGIASGIVGGLTSGLMLGLGINLVVQGAYIGWVLVVPAAPAGALFGWIMGRRLAKRL